jgi:orotidine-5'-phosphate decarboxylase
LENGLNKDAGLLINSSRGIIYSSNSEDFAQRAAQEAEKLVKVMKPYL